MTIRNVLVRAAVATGLAGALAVGLAVPSGAAQQDTPVAAVPGWPAMACAQIGEYVPMLNHQVPTCALLWTAGRSSIVLPADTPRVKYGVLSMPGSGKAPNMFIDRTGRQYAFPATQGNRWLTIGPRKVSQTILAVELKNNQIVTSFPVLFVADDALTDRFAGKTFIGRTANVTGTANIKMWTRIDWQPGVSINDGLYGKITNYKQNVLDAGVCREALVKQHPDMVKSRFGQKGKIELTWRHGLYAGQASTLTIITDTTASFSHPAPSTLLLTQKLWQPGKIFFTLDQSDKGLAKIYVDDIVKASVAQKCSL